MENQFSKIDKSNMREVILDFPKQFKIGNLNCENLKFKSKKLKSFSNIIICGMGGSALPGDVLQLTNRNLQTTTLPIIVHRDYGLPKETNKNSLIICISYSGNTEETISAFNEAQKRRIKAFVISSGGKLIEFAKKYKIPFVLVPSGIQPRCALGYQFSALVKILSDIGVIKNIDKILEKLENILEPQKIEVEGKNLAKKLLGFIPIVYSSNKWKVVSKIWKIKFNENSKLPSFFNFFPELNHNEMVGIGQTQINSAKKLLKFLFLIDSKEDHKRNLKRMRTTAKIFKDKGFGVIFVDIDRLTRKAKKTDNKTLYFFEKLFSSILLGDWVSYYLAIFQKIDPTPVNLVEEFKNKIK